METQFDIPILYIVFNRLDVVKQTFAEIRKIGPKQLFIGADGPRNPGEKKKTDEVRKYILDNIDWECKVKTLFQKENFGCNIGTFKSVDWFFKNVKMGIILEDDDLPSRSFFPFCKEMLIKYEKNPKVMSISGFNPINTSSLKESYYFSKYFGIWGWASWRDRWQKSNLLSSDYEKVEKEKSLNTIIKNPIERIIIQKRFRHYLLNGVKGWDYSWAFLHYKNNGICIKPKKSLIKNLGFMEDSTNTTSNFIDRKYLFAEASELEFPLIHPVKIEQNKALCRKEFRKEFMRAALKRMFVALGIIKYKYSY